ncbi:MAG TPA: glycosyltransferase family 4 protein [Terriglobia bacterium]|nr:glycosyltransferase family 4 protein [Terriglobia bacterium]
MNILVVAAYPPVLHMHGGGVRMFHNIRILAEKHSVRVISFVESEEERELLRSLEAFCDSVTAVKRVPDFRPHWFSLLPFLMREFSAPEMYRAVESAFRKTKVDVLQCEYLQMAQFYWKGILNVLTLHEAVSANAWEAFQRESDPLQKLRLFYRWMATLRYEVSMCRRFDRVVTMTEDDAAYLRSYSPAANIRAIPIGIDPEEFSPGPEEPARPIEILFVGNFRHQPNVEAAEFLIEHIAPHFSNIRFVISGSHLPDHVRRLPNVDFPGYAADTRRLYHRPYTIVVAPLFSGTGQRVKLLEAFAMGCPVITTSIGAKGFPLKNGIESLIADSAKDFIAALTELISSIDIRMRLATNARRMIERDFSWNIIGAQLFDVVTPRLVR